MNNLQHNYGKGIVYCLLGGSILILVGIPLTLIIIGFPIMLIGVFMILASPFLAFRVRFGKCPKCQANISTMQDHLKCRKCKTKLIVTNNEVSEVK